MNSILKIFISCVFITFGLSLPLNFESENGPIKATPKQLCEICSIVLPVIRSLIDKNKTDHFDSVAEFFCNEFKIVDPVVCSTIIPEYKLSILSVIKDSSLNNSELCEVALNCRRINNPILNWNITLPNRPKPPVIPPMPPKSGSPTMRILQLTDIHIDFDYEPASIADCLDPLCCRKNSTPSGRNSSGAGYWGDYRNCDIPHWTVENMLKNIAKNEKFDFIYWTGDLPPHNIWNQTKNDQLQALSHLSKLFIKYFPHKIIYSTLGNHEASPCNLFPPPFVQEDNINWLYKALSTNWTALGLPEALKPNITNGAFYTLLVKPGLRLISLNTNYCPSRNYWLLINSTDPLGQLEWLANVLQYSEDNQEKVHIIGHIYPSGCMQSWSENYYRIINRYESTITGQFFGHSHNDQFEIFYDEENNTRATNIAYIAPSVTTFSYLNPGYRIYTIDGIYKNSSWRVLNHETRILNLTKANLYKKPKWELEYKAKETYSLKNLFPQDWSDLIDKAIKDLNENNDEYFKILYKYFSKSSDFSKPCDRRCKQTFLCSFKQARPNNLTPCS